MKAFQAKRLKNSAEDVRASGAVLDVCPTNAAEMRTIGMDRGSWDSGIPDMSIEASMVSYYAERAAEYERIYHKPERQADLLLLRRFVERTFAGADVFEVACGTGYWTEILSRSAASVVATDINQEVLTIARSKSMDPHKTTFRIADAYHLPVFSTSFTGGLSAFWWSHVPKARLRDFLRAFRRLFAPDARIVFIDNRFVEGSSTPISRIDEQGDTYQTRRLDNGTTYEVLKNFPTESELHAAVEGLAGDVQLEFLRYYWTLSYVPRADP
jgi:ubiquinone/menaquinone biosynthesis C-methylase UbiE